MGAEDATLYQGMGLTQEEYLRMSHSPRPIEASKAGSHVKSTQEWLTQREGGSVIARRWLNLSVSVALAEHIIQPIGKWRKCVVFCEGIQRRGEIHITLYLSWVGRLSESLWFCTDQYCFASKDIKRYDTIGQELLKSFDKLRSLYNAVKFVNSADIDLTPYELKFEQINEQAKQISISEQAACTQILSNISFFSTMQTDWIDEQLHFELKDKFPFYHYEAIGLYFIIIIILAMFVRSVLM